MTVEPGGTVWRQALSGPAPVDPTTVLTRSALGLATDRPVVLSGHQAGVWHAGILAKLIAVGAASASSGAAAAWVVVDQDANEPGELAFPARVADRQAGVGRAGVERREVVLTGAKRVPRETPTGSRPRLIGPGPGVDVGPYGGVIGRIVGASGESAAAQVAGANAAMAAERVGLSVPLVMATGLSRTAGFAAWVGRMREDPAACVAAYNAAVGSVPEAGLRALGAKPEQGRFELPLWRVRAGEPRQPVYSVQLDRIDPAELAPRALMMTGLLRAYGCELFVHGTGGGVYERAMEAWVGAWLGLRVGAGLAPMAVVTATLRLGEAEMEALGVQTPKAGEEEVRRARWRLHAARHDPAMLGDGVAAAQKRALVAEIAAARAAGLDPRPAYRRMHQLLERVRAERAPELDRLERQIGLAERAGLDWQMVQGREWPWVLHGDAALAGLAGAIGRRLWVAGGG